MTHDDHETTATPGPILDDEAVEAILAGDDVDPRFAHLVDFTQTVRSLCDDPPPSPSPTLAAVIAAGGRPDGACALRIRRRRSRAVRRLSLLRRRAKIGIAVSAGAATVVAAGAAGALPARANDFVRDAIEVVTPVEYSEGSRPRDATSPGHDAGGHDTLLPDGEPRRGRVDEFSAGQKPGSVPPPHHGAGTRPQARPHADPRSPPGRPSEGTNGRPADEVAAPGPPPRHTASAATPARTHSKGRPATAE
ncbi:MAG: hypothetical protein ACRD0U_07250 [Acidimicrobiales bacterium]